MLLIFWTGDLAYLTASFLGEGSEFDVEIRTRQTV